MKNSLKVWLGISFCSLVLVSVIFSQQIVTAVETVTANEGQRVQMSASAEGNSPMVFRWYKKGATDTLVFTGEIYVIEQVKLSDAGNYYIVATNSVGTAQSGITTLNIVSSPVSGIAPAFIYIEARDDARTK